MTLAVPGTTPFSMSSRAPSIVVVGADTLLGALPATPVQLAHACLRVGFHHVVPASWGDELVAGAALRLLEHRPSTPAVQCSCPLVAHRLLSVSTDLRPFLVSLVSPPVALARYLRALYGAAQLRITYVGRCPGANDPGIDAHLLPEELFALFAEHHIVVGDEPTVFDSVIPPDRRRHFSQPGGIPNVEALWSSGRGRTLVELAGEDLSIELAQILLTDAPVLVDAAAALGCVCCGGTFEHDVDEGRALLASLEPPRAQTPVVDTRVPVILELPLQSSPPAEARTPAAFAARQASPAAPRAGAPQAVRHVVMPPPTLPYHAETEPPHVSPSDEGPPDITDDPRSPVDLSPESGARTEEGTLHREATEPVIDEFLPEERPGRDADAADTATPMPDESALEPLMEPSISPPVHQDARGPAALRRRTPVHGIARVAQGEIPMARATEGRPLPRAYVSHRRQAQHGARAVAESREPELPSAPENAASPPSANGSSREAADLAHPVGVALPPLPPPPTPTPTAAPPAHEEGFSAPPPPAAGVAAAELSLATSDAQEISRVTKRLNEPQRPRESERPVELPLARLSDRAASTQAREATRVDAAPAPGAQARPPVRSWTMLVIIVAIVALLSSAAGVALGTWYTRSRATAPAQR